MDIFLRAQMIAPLSLIPRKTFLSELGAKHNIFVRTRQANRTHLASQKTISKRSWTKAATDT
jgi:hypothetical protein